MKYFTLHELTRSATAELRGINNTPSQEAVANLHLLVEHILDPLREAWGKPIKVNSGFRCPRLNKEVGGSPSSQHMKGEAADITVGNRADNRRLYHCSPPCICQWTKPSMSEILRGFTSLTGHAIAASILQSDKINIHTP